MEKKRAERERQKLEKEEKKKQQQGNVSDAGSKPSKPEEEEDIIGNLMKEIRRGKTLRRRSENQSGGSSQPKRPGTNLKQDDILAMQKVYEESATKPVNGQPEASAAANIPKIDVKTDGHVSGHGEQARAAKTVTSDSQLVHRKDRVKSEAFTDMQLGRKDQVRHSIHYMPHYETTV